MPSPRGQSVTIATGAAAGGSSATGSSSSRPRSPLDIIEARWQGDASNAPGVTVPFFDVVNSQVDLDTMPDPWGGAIYQPDSRKDVSTGSKPYVLESGVFAVGLFTKSGTGPRTLDDAVRQIRNAFHGWESDGLRVDRVEGPLNTEPQSEGNWWQLALVLVYEYRFRRDATGPGFGTQQGLAP